MPLWHNRENRDYHHFMHFKCIEFYNKSLHDMMIISVNYLTYSSQSTYKPCLLKCAQTSEMFKENTDKVDIDIIVVNPGRRRIKGDFPLPRLNPVGTTNTNTITVLIPTRISKP